MVRKKLTLTTRLASALLALGDIPYDDAKQMSEDQIISLYEFDHGILHETGHPDRDKFWNQTPRLIRGHREKTKRDRKIIDKGRRIRIAERLAHIDYRLTRGETLGLEDQDFLHKHFDSRKLRSRGFDKTRRRRMDGTVVKR